MSEFHVEPDHERTWRYDGMLNLVRFRLIFHGRSATKGDMTARQDVLVEAHLARGRDLPAMLQHQAREIARQLEDTGPAISDVKLVEVLEAVRRGWEPRRWPIPKPLPVLSADGPIPLDVELATWPN